LIFRKNCSAWSQVETDGFAGVFKGGLENVVRRTWFFAGEFVVIR